jgi:hypothetical protein
MAQRKQSFQGWVPRHGKYCRFIWVLASLECSKLGDRFSLLRNPFLWHNIVGRSYCWLCLRELSDAHTRALVQKIPLSQRSPFVPSLGCLVLFSLLKFSLSNGSPLSLYQPQDNFLPLFTSLKIVSLIWAPFLQASGNTFQHSRRVLLHPSCYVNICALRSPFSSPPSHQASDH